MTSSDEPPYAAGAVAQLEWMRAQLSGTWSAGVAGEPDSAFAHGAAGRSQTESIAAQQGAHGGATGQTGTGNRCGCEGAAPNQQVAGATPSVADGAYWMFAYGPNTGITGTLS